MLCKLCGGQASIGRGAWLTTGNYAERACSRCVAWIGTPGLKVPPIVKLRV